MSISYLAKSRRAIFETQKSKVKDWVKYYGEPPNKYKEFIIVPDILNNWIYKKIHYKIPEINFSAVAIDYIILFWKVSFFLEEDRIWFIGEALCGAGYIVLKTKDYTVKIKDTESCIDTDTGELILKTIKFSAPAPMLKSIVELEEYGMKTTYILNVKWSLQKHEKSDSNYTEEIHYNNYEMQIWEKNIRAIIYPVSLTK